MLISQQNGTELLKLFQEVKSTNSDGRAFDGVVVALSYQPILSFAAKFEVTSTVARAKLAGKDLKVCYSTYSTRSHVCWNFCV